MQTYTQDYNSELESVRFVRLPSNQTDGQDIRTVNAEAIKKREN